MRDTLRTMLVECPDCGRRVSDRAKNCPDCACPVAEVCLWWAVAAEWDLSYRFGIWGGVGPAVRARLAELTGIGYARTRFVATAAQWSGSADTTAVA